MVQVSCSVAAAPAAAASANASQAAGDSQVLVQFRTESGEPLMTPLNVPLAISRDNLQRVCNALLENESQLPYALFVGEQRITDTLAAALQPALAAGESVLDIVYQPEATFRVRAVTRCTGQMEGHAQPVLTVAFSPDSRWLASGAADCCVRLWRPHTQLPERTCTGHEQAVLCLAWSPDASRLASGCRAGQLRLWHVSGDQQGGQQQQQQGGVSLSGHRRWITQLCWRPLAAHDEADSTPCRLLASASKDGDVRVWDVLLARCVRVLSGHTLAVTGVRWSGQDRLFSCSQDRTVRVWCPHSGRQLLSLSGHAHWINTLALSSEHVLRAGQRATLHSVSEARAELAALLEGGAGERLVTGSDDFTMLLWQPDSGSSKPLARLTGHQQLVNDVRFSPDGRLLASASFDRSVRLWNGLDGRFVAVLRGHVQAVYMAAWSSDSRLLVTASADSTLKVWQADRRALLHDLPGHGDQVYAVDWSPDGERVASGGKDCLVRLWQR